MVGNFVTVAFAQDDLPDFHVPSEHLVEVTSLSMGLSSLFHRSRELEGPQLLDDIRHVVVEVTTHDNRSGGILSDDVPNDVNVPLCPLFEVLLVSWLQVTVKNLEIYVAQL